MENNRQKQKTANTVRNLVVVAVLIGVATVVFFIIYKNTGVGVFYTMFITCLTIFYHFAMRLAVGESVTLYFKNHSINYDSWWFQRHSYEDRLYKLLRVKRWKGGMITAKPEQFDMTNNTMRDLLFYMTQGEVVHEICMVLAFVPLLFIIPFGTAPAFSITSIASCILDYVSVVIQRYNRPRVLRLIEREERMRKRKEGK